MRLGIFGGTFDPPHTGHLIVAQDALRVLRLDRIVFVPAAVPPHKRTAPITDAALRLALVRAAIAGDDRFVVDDIELERAGPSYTVDTLRAYRARYPDAELTLLLGADQFAEFDSWHEAAAIRTLATLGVLSRSGKTAAERSPDTSPSPSQSQSQSQSLPGVVRLDITRIDISATDIRRRVAAGEPIRYLVPATVERLIRERTLYAPPGGSVPPNRVAATG